MAIALSCLCPPTATSVRFVHAVNVQRITTIYDQLDELNAEPNTQCVGARV